MRHSLQIFGSWRTAGLICATAGITLAVTAGVAFAVFPTDNVTHYTGCLNTNASPGGTFSNVAVGETPAKACSSGQMLVHLSGGDITSVNAGTGLAGGSINGEANVSVASTYQLPQGCTNDNIAKWVSSTSLWRCAADENGGGTITGVAAGTGLTGGGTSGNVSLALGSGYQLPQNCSSGQVPKSGGSNTWSCQTDQSGSSDAYLGSANAFVELPNDSTLVELTHVQVPAGNYVVMAKVETADADNDAATDCFINSPSGTVDESESESQGSDLGDHGVKTISLMGTVSVSALGFLSLDCKAFTPGGAEAGRAKIVATKVATLH